MAYYNVCPNCGSNLDPGEKCTCLEEKTKQQEFLNRHFKVTKTGQISFVFGEGTKKLKIGGRDIE